MIKTILKIDGMMCSMCEAHMNDAIRKGFAVDNVTSSHSKKETVIISKNELDREKLTQVVEVTGYKVLEIKSEQYEKKGLFSKFMKN